MLSNVKAMALERKATISWQTFADDIDDYLSGQAADNWRKIFRPLIQGVVTDQVNRWSNTLGLTWDVANLFARDWYNRYVKKMPIPIIDTTKEAVGKIIDDAIKGGWSIPNMQQAIEDAFSIMQDYRTERIARTEVIRASNAGSTEQFKAWGVGRHEWISTKDDRTRDDHVDADGQVVDIDKPFSVGGEDLEYPGDPNGSAGNTINCRCSTLPIIEGMEGGGDDDTQ